MSSSFSLKVLTTLLLLASTSVALAAAHKAASHYKDEAIPCPVPASLKDGFYVGIQGGYDAYRVHDNIALPISTALGGNSNMHATGWVGGLFVGYGRVIGDTFYLGTEIFGNYNGSSSSYALASPVLGNYASKFTIKGNYGISLLPGVKVTSEALVYVRLGYNFATFQTQEYSTSTVTSSTQTNTGNGFNYGLGLETLAYKNFSVRAEYTYTNYTSFNSGMGTTFSPADNQFMLGLIYHIA